MKLIFVYNVDSNLFALITGIAHKLATSKTYQCNLCKLTYPFASMDKEWKKFIASLSHQAVFLHRDEFHEQYPDQKDNPLPAVFFIEDDSGIRLLISAEEINEAKNVSELIEITKRSLPKENGNVYRCNECGLGYKDKETAAKCQAWCKKHKSCNLDIIKYAIKENGNASSR